MIEKLGFEYDSTYNIYALIWDNKENARPLLLDFGLSFFNYIFNSNPPILFTYSL